MCVSISYMATVQGAAVELARSRPFIIQGPSLSITKICGQPGTEYEETSPPGAEVPLPRIIVSYVSSTLHDSRGKAAVLVAVSAVHRLMPRGAFGTDWIGMCRLGGKPNTGAVRNLYDYVPAAPTGLVTFETKYVPRETGQYEVVYVHNQGEILAHSNAFEIFVAPNGVVSAKLLPLETHE